MLKVHVILNLLSSLEHYLAHLETLTPDSLDTWSTDFTGYWAALHGLQMAVQHIVDIGAHILVAQNLATPADYRETLLELGRNGIIPLSFAERISPMAGFRNVIVHQYLGVDPAKVLDIMQNHLDDFRKFSEYIIEYLQREGFLSEP